MTTNKNKLSNKEIREANEFIRAMFNGDKISIENLLGMKPIVIGSEENILKELHNKNSNLSKYMNELSKCINGAKVNNKQDIKGQEHKTQIGDEVLILDSPEGIKNVKGTIVDEVKGTEQFLVKLSDLNALYIDKDKVQVIKKKQNIEEINKIKDKVEQLKISRKTLINEVQSVVTEINELKECQLTIQEELTKTSKALEQYKQQLEQLEGTDNEI